MNGTLTEFYERDIRRLIDEINLFACEEDMWKTSGAIKNAGGNLALHIIGGTNYLIGSVLAQNGYVRNRDQEFARKGVPREELVNELEKLIPLVTQTINAIQLDATYPLPFDGMSRTNHYLLTQLLLHLNYHIGQVNYLRRGLQQE